MIDDGEAKSLSEIAKKEGLTRARVTEILNLLKLPAGFQEFLAGLKDPNKIQRYSERKLRPILSALPPYEHSGKSVDEMVYSLINNPTEAAESST